MHLKIIFCSLLTVTMIAGCSFHRPERIVELQPSLKEFVSDFEKYFVGKDLSLFKAAFFGSSKYEGIEYNLNRPALAYLNPSSYTIKGTAYFDSGSDTNLFKCDLNIFFDNDDKIIGIGPRYSLSERRASVNECSVVKTFMNNYVEHYHDGITEEEVKQNTDEFISKILNDKGVKSSEGKSTQYSKSEYNTAKKIQSNTVNPRQLYMDCTLGSDLSSCKEGLEVMPTVQMDEKTKGEVIQEMHEKACDLNDYDECIYASAKLLDGEHFFTYNYESQRVTSSKIIGRQVEKGLNYLIKACNHGNGQACGHIAALMWGKERSMTGNQFSDSEKNIIGKLLGFNYNNDEQRTNKIFEYSKKACNLDRVACWHLGLYYELGIPPVKKDIDKALTYYLYSDQKERENEKNKKITVSLSAGSLGKIYERKHDYKKALSYYERDCFIYTNNGGDPQYWSSCQNADRLKNK